MEEQLNKIAKEVGKKIRTLLKDENKYDANVNFQIDLGKYSIHFYRSKPEYEKNALLIDFSLDFYQIIKEAITEMHNLWMEEEKNIECAGEDDTNEYSITCSVDGEVDDSETIIEIKNRVQILKKSLKSVVESEDYEKAGKIKKQIQDLESKISDWNSNSQVDGEIDSK